MSDRPTPETDALDGKPTWQENVIEKGFVPADHARRLERERDEAREALEFRRGLYKIQEECLENAREQVKELIYIADRAIALADIDFENDKFGVVSELRGDLEKIKKSK